MHIEINKKERTILFTFGTAKLEGDMFNYIYNNGKNIMNAVNNLHLVTNTFVEDVRMRVYGLKIKKKNLLNGG